MPKVGVLGGTSLLESSLFAHLQPEVVPTPHGPAIVHASADAEGPLFVQRHHADGAAGAETYRPPHLINHRANIAALKALGAHVVVAVCSVGSLTRTLPPGSLLLPDDFFALHCPPYSVFSDDRGHVVPGFDAGVRAAVGAAVAAADVSNYVPCGGVYAQTMGPRFETPAEVRFLSSVADVVGMTAAYEANVAKELGLPYAVIAMVDNMANGLDAKPLTLEEFKESVRRNQAAVERAVSAALDALQTASPRPPAA